MVNEYNANVESYRQQYGIRREFEKGVYDGKEINIYQFRKNADLRLTPLAQRLGLVDAARWAATEGKRALLSEARTFADAERFAEGRLSAWLRRPEANPASLPEALRARFPEEIWSLLETDLKYEGYIRRQQSQIHRDIASESRPLPPGLDFASIPQLRAEARQKLSAIRPSTFGQAGRISGITPADLALVEIWLRKHSQ